MQIIDNVESTTTLEELTSVYQAFVESYGFTSIAMSQISNPLLLDDPANRVFITTWNPEWLAHWLENRYYEHDPVIHHLLRTRKIFSWDTAYEQASKIGKKIFDESREFGFKTGMTFPVSTGAGPIGIVSLGADDVDFDEKTLEIIQTVTRHVYMHFVKLNNLELEYLVDRLTKRETEIMHLVSQGKTNWEIAQILGLSEETVKTNLKRVSQKLNTVNRAHAVSEAIRKGFILG